MSDLEARARASLRDSYTIESELGIGGMGVVFLAHDTKHMRKVAIKFMRPELSSPSSIARFKREIVTVAQLAHPGILPIHDSGLVDGMLYYVMPFVEGGSLRELLDRETQLPFEKAVAIITDVGESVAYAHKHGVVHRDLKPENILLQSNRPVISDFGLASWSTDGLSETGETELFRGTALYMAPEQASEAKVDARADIYALSCIFYEMLAGNPPITGPNRQAIVTRKMLGHFPALRDARPSVPRSIERTIEKGLAPVPADRYEDVDAFLRAVHFPKSRIERFTPVLAPLLLAAVVGGAAYVSTQSAWVDPSTVIVDEFENRTGDSSLTGIGASLADWTAQGLQGTRLKTVVPTPTALQASRFARREIASGSHDDPLALLAKETGAGIIVSGSYYRKQDWLTFHTQVSLASQGWLQRILRQGVRVRLQTTLTPVVVHRDSTELAISEIRARVMAALALMGAEPEFSAPDLDRRPPTYEAYEHFNVGMSAYIANDHRRAASEFNEAYRLDTSFVVSLLYSALASSNMREFATEDSLLSIVSRHRDRLSTYHKLWLEYRQALLQENRPKALRAVRSLAAQAPQSKASYNLAIEAWEDGHLEESLKALETLRPEIGPVRNFLPYWGALANVHHLLGHYRDALIVSRQAQAAHPDMWWPVGWELGAMAALGDVDAVVNRANDIAVAGADELGWTPTEAIREGAEELRAHGHPVAAKQLWLAALRGYGTIDGSKALSIRDQLGLTKTLYALGRYQEAGEVAKRLGQAAPGDFELEALQGTIAARTGDTLTAIKALNQLAAVDLPYQFGEPQFQAARVAAVLGKKAIALGLLRTALAHGAAYGSWIHTEIDWEPLRNTAAFKTLLRPVPLRID